MAKSDLNESQDSIAKTLNGMVVVDAGPGTGKTKTIVERYINMISEDVQPKDIVLMTFTRNAAQEMEERIKSRMILEGCSRMCKDVRVSTFDSFCFSVLMESPETVSRFFGIDERMTRGSRTVENETLNRVYFSDMADRFLADHGDDYGAVATIASQNIQDLYSLINSLMARGIMPLRKGWFGGDDGRVLTGDSGSVFGELVRMNALEEGSNRMCDLLRSFRSGGNGVSEIPGVSLKEINAFPEDILRMAACDDRGGLLDFMHDIYYEFIRRSIIDDRLTFGLVALFAFVVLYADDRTRERMRCRYLMVDEFQDTNSNQFMISLMLLEEPNMCVVGDWKQGIYGFRYVSVENITRFQDRGRELCRFLNDDKVRIPFSLPECISLSLDVNYRSSQRIIDLAYKALDIKATDKEEVHLDNIQVIKAAKEYLDGYTAIESVSASSQDEEVREIVRRIQHYIIDDRYVICEGEGSFRKVTYSDIAVLCRKRSMAREVYEAVRDAGMPVFLQGDVEVMGSREGKLLLAWLKYTNNEDDPWGICTILADQGYPLCEMREMMDRGSDTGLPEDIVGFRKELIRKKRRVTSLITSVFEYYGLNNDITQAIISIMSSAHRGSLLTISDMVRMIEKDIEEETTYNMDSSLDTKAVVIQTMHKSKGLEYPVVIAAGFNTKSFPDTNGDRSEYVFSDMTGIRSKSEIVTVGDDECIMKSWKSRLVSAAVPRDYSEERRLLFVVISRAKQYLTFTSADKPSEFFKGLEPFSEHSVCGKGAVSSMCGTGVSELSDRPEIAEFSRRRRNIGVHDILHFEGEEVPPEGSDQVCGKGMEYGTKVHHVAELMARGLPPGVEQDEMPETVRIKEILDSLSDSVYMEPEIECSLSFNDLGITLRGVIDLYVEFPDHVEIHDYKTDVSDRFEDEYRMQLSVYANAAMEVTGKRAVCIIDYVSQGRSVVFEPFIKKSIMERLADYT